jgi:hypothetical protein
VPYFVYRVWTFPILKLEPVEAPPTYAGASAVAKALRATPELAPGCTVRVIFAATPLEAEDLLSQVRAPKSGLDGDE